MSEFDDDDIKPTKSGNFTEFNCPSCTANNPIGDGFTFGDEVRCMYCAAEYKVMDRGEGKVRLKEL